MLVGTRRRREQVERAQRGAGGVGRDAARHDRRPRRSARGDRRDRPGGAAADPRRGAGAGGAGRARAAHGGVAPLRRRGRRPGRRSDRRRAGDRRRPPGPPPGRAAVADRRRGPRAGGDADPGRDRPGPHLRVVAGAGGDHVRARRGAARVLADVHGALRHRHRPVRAGRHRRACSPVPCGASSCSAGPPPRRGCWPASSTTAIEVVQR